MLNVKTPKEVFEIIDRNIFPLNKTEETEINKALRRTLAEDIVSREYIPNFTRSAVDGFAIKASDSFGCSESIPAILKISEEIKMGEMPGGKLEDSCCMKIPTGGALPQGADAVVMLEYTEDYHDGYIGIFKSAAPGENIIYKGDDKKPNETVLKKGTRLLPFDIASLAAMGIQKLKLAKVPTVGIISTGNEIIPSKETPKEGQIRNVNSDLLSALCLDAGADYIDFGIIKDDEKELSKALDKALAKCDMVLISGGSSAGEKDYAAEVIKSKGKLLLHGIAMKPGKPTILGIAGGKPVFGLPGHPVASYFVANIFCKYALDRLLGRQTKVFSVKAILTESIESNHGRAQYGAVKLFKKNGKLYASPVHSKSGLITSLAETDAYYEIDSQCEGIAKGKEIEVYIYER